MRMNRLVVVLAGAAFAAPLLGHAARADLLVSVDKSAQRMVVVVDGQPRYNWPVSTGRIGYDTPNGTFRPFRMEIDHHSDEWDNAPMPYSIFFTMNGVAVHGTKEQRNLGKAASHGCVRLSVDNAAKLWDLVKQEQMAHTTVIVAGATPKGGMPVAGAGQAPIAVNSPANVPLPPGPPPARKRGFFFFFQR